MTSAEVMVIGQKKKPSKMVSFLHKEQQNNVAV